MNETTSHGHRHGPPGEGETMTVTRRSGTTGLAVTLLAGVVALGGCGAITFAHAGPAPAASSAAAMAPPSSDQPSGTTTVPPASTPTPATTTAAPKPSPKPVPKPSPTPTPKPTPKKPGDTLNPGDSGAYVLSVQQQLSGLGYWNGTPDGQYGMLTVQAVMALQKAAGLGRDGVFGPSTRRALLAGVRPVSRLGGDGVEIDKARQLLLMVRGGRVTMILNTSTGSGQHYSYAGADRIATTPSGVFSVFRTVNHLDKGPLGDLWRPRYFNGGIAVHGAAAIPGYPASHGCARVSDPAMDMIWANDLMPVGSRVAVY
jgi:hypothetical protein